MTKARETADVVDSKNQCTAWCSFDGRATGTNAPIAGYNVASIERISTGRYIINFTTPMDNANYAIVGTSDAAGTAGAQRNVTTRETTHLVGSCEIIITQAQITLVDGSGAVSIIVFGGKN